MAQQIHFPIFGPLSLLLVMLASSFAVLHGQVYKDGLSSAIEKVRLKHPIAVDSACELVRAGFFVEFELSKSQESMSQLDQSHKAELAALAAFQNIIDNLLQSNWSSDSSHRDYLLKEEQEKYDKKTSATRWNSETQEMEIYEKSYTYNPPSLLGAYSSTYREIFQRWPGEARLMADRFLVECRSSPKEVIAFLSTQYGFERRAFESDWEGWDEVQNFYRELSEIAQDESWESKNCEPNGVNETRANPAFLNPKD